MNFCETREKLILGRIRSTHVRGGVLFETAVLLDTLQYIIQGGAK